jgi:sporulation protein YlmC with PRC-barrel domain
MKSAWWGKSTGRHASSETKEDCMAMDNPSRISHLIGETVLDIDGDKVGKVTEIAFRPDTEVPEWLVVKTSLFGRWRLVPLGAAEELGDTLRVPYGRDTVLQAPVPEIPVTLAPSERDALLEHYAHAA